MRSARMLSGVPSEPRFAFSVRPPYASTLAAVSVLRYSRFASGVHFVLHVTMHGAALRCPTALSVRSCG